MKAVFCVGVSTALILVAASSSPILTHIVNAASKPIEKKTGIRLHCSHASGCLLLGKINLNYLQLQRSQDAAHYFHKSALNLLLDHCAITCK